MGLLSRRNRGNESLTRALMTRNALADSAPAGSVNALGGVRLPSAYGLGGTGHDPTQALLNVGAMAPGLGDILGPIADLRMMATRPETRTLGNAGLFALSLLPAVPSLTAMMALGGKPTRAGRKQAGALGSVDVKLAGEKRRVPYAYGDISESDIEAIENESYRLAELAAAKRYGIPTGDLTQRQLSNYGAGALRTLDEGDTVQWMWPAEAALHEHMREALGLNPLLSRGMVYLDD